MRSAFYMFMCISLFSCTNATPEKPAVPKAEIKAPDIDKSLADIIGAVKADIGVAIIGPGGDVVAVNGDKPYAMMSVCKFPQALTLLRLVDVGTLSIDERVEISPEDLKPNTRSTLKKDHPQASFDLSIPEALSYSIGQSDNITSNVIFRMEGGPDVVETYMHAKGISDIGINIDYTEFTDETVDSNWCYPKAMAQLLEKFYAKQMLGEKTQTLLWDAMVNSTSGPDRLKGLLPPGTVVAHKTGSSGTDKKTGAIIATNDVGIVMLPDGRHFSIAVFVADSYETKEATANVIARIARAAWDSYVSLK